MSHLQPICFIKTLSQHLTNDYKGIKILEIGSFDVNGSIRKFFKGSYYLGVDLAAGPGVDVIIDGKDIDHADNSYHITISSECFEHNPSWLETFENMYRMTSPGGFIIFTCATRGRTEHGTLRTSPKLSPGTQEVGLDYYMNLEEKNFQNKINIPKLFDEHIFIINKYSCDLYFVGKKHGFESRFNFNKAYFIKEHNKNQKILQKNLFKQRPLYSVIFTPLTYLINIPILIAMNLPDRHYQNFVLNYNLIIEKIKSPIRKILLSFF
jgi:SAM-dependent methyltransferase